MPGVGKESILGRLRDERKFSVVLVNRIEELFDEFMKTAGATIEKFCNLDKGKLWGIYNGLHPEGNRGAGEGTWKAFQRFCAIWRELQCDARQIAKATVEEQERKEAERASMREELLERKVDFDTLTNAMAALGTLGIKECAIGKLLEMYEMAKAAKGGAQ